MKSVTFVGLGPMGTALAVAALHAGFDTTVWNRDVSRTEPFIEKGATCERKLSKAIERSPLVIVCVRDYMISDELLREPECSKALRGRVLVQLSTGSAMRARESSSWFAERGIAYLDGAIMASTSQIGGGQALILTSGDATAFSQAERVLRTMAPQLEYLGRDPGAASALDSALLSTSVGLFLGVFNGAALCESFGIPLTTYAKHLRQMINDDIASATDALQKLVEDRLDETDAPIEVWAATIDNIVESAEATGFSTDISEFMRETFRRAVEQGFGHQSIGALMNSMRRKYG